jgi:hypothetical protein
VKKKLVSIALMAGLIAGSFGMPAADAAKKKKRTERVVEFDYVCPCPGTFQLGGLTGGDPNLGGGVVAVGAESYVNITAADTSGTSVLVSVQQDTNGDGFNDPVAEVCAGGEKGKPAKIMLGAEMRLFITTGTCEDGSPSIPLGGTLTITLSNLP